jgi:hypothetical protein
MQVEILSHDTNTYMAKLRFTHNGVVVEDTYNLLLVEPTMQSTLIRTNSTFSVELQQSVIDTLTGWVKNGIEQGALVNRLAKP